MGDKYTPGPWWAVKCEILGWEVKTLRDHWPNEDHRGEHGAGICSLIGDHTEKRTSGNEEANARLISSAPDLLEAAQVCLKAEKERRKKLLPGAPATTYCERRIAIIEAAITKATGETK